MIKICGGATVLPFIEGGYVCVDKTYYIERLHDKGQFFFLGRLRRFGKSLFSSDRRIDLFVARNPYPDRQENLHAAIANSRTSDNLIAMDETSLD